MIPKAEVDIIPQTQPTEVDTPLELAPNRFRLCVAWFEDLGVLWDVEAVIHHRRPDPSVGFPGTIDCETRIDGPVRAWRREWQESDEPHGGSGWRVVDPSTEGLRRLNVISARAIEDLEWLRTVAS